MNCSLSQCEKYVKHYQIWSFFFSFFFIKKGNVGQLAILITFSYQFSEREKNKNFSSWRATKMSSHDCQFLVDFDWWLQIGILRKQINKINPNKFFFSAKKPALKCWFHLAKTKNVHKYATRRSRGSWKWIFSTFYEKSIFIVMSHILNTRFYFSFHIFFFRTQPDNLVIVHAKTNQRSGRFVRNMKEECEGVNTKILRFAVDYRCLRTLLEVLLFRMYLHK